MNVITKKRFSLWNFQLIVNVLSEDEDRRRKEAEEQAKRESERQKRDEERLRQEQERIKQIVQEEASKEIRELKVKAVELENSLEREKEQNKENSTRIAELQAKLQKAMQELEEERRKNKQLRQTLDEKEGKGNRIAYHPAWIAKLSSQVQEAQKMSEQNEQLKMQMKEMKKMHEEENARFIAKELEAAMEQLNIQRDDMLIRWDNKRISLLILLLSHRINKSSMYYRVFFIYCEMTRKSLNCIFLFD